MHYHYQLGLLKEKSKIVPVILASLLALGLVFTQLMQAKAAVTTVTVRPSSTQGWVFNGNPANTTPYEFTTAKQSIGDGSIYVLPIGSTNVEDKFTANKTLATPVADITSLAYDFQIAGSGTSSDANKTYLNVYANIDNSSTNFFDCSFDYAPTTGSTTNFTTANFAATDTPSNVRLRGTRIAACPATLAGMPAGSYVRAITVNVGDRSNTDFGLGAYLDKVVVNTTNDTVTYDFEADLTYPVTKDDCKQGGWATFTGKLFKNQGDCVSWVASQGRSDARN